MLVGRIQVIVSEKDSLKSSVSGIVSEWNDSTRDRFENSYIQEIVSLTDNFRTRAMSEATMLTQCKDDMEKLVRDTGHYL